MPTEAPESPPAPEFLTVDEAADLLRVDRKTIYSEIAASRMPHIKLGRVIRIPRGVIDSLSRKSR